MTRTPPSPSRAASLAAAAALAVAAGACGGGGRAPEDLPYSPHPVVIVAIDGLAADRVGAFGAKDGRTPALDALARESVAFAWAFAQAPDGAPSLASLLTGFYPSTHRVRRAGDTLPGEARTLAEAMAGAGYETAAFAAGEGVTADLGFAQGFASFEARAGAGLDGIGSRAAAWMKERAAKNFLLLVQAGVPAGSGADRGGALAATDAALGDFVEAFRALGLDDRATLVVLGTCGTVPGGEESDGGPSLRAAETRVPLLVRFPGGARARVVEEYVEILDVGPTLIEAAGIVPGGHAHGRSLLPLIRGEGRPPYIAFGESPRRGGQRFVALAGYQLVHTDEGDRNEIFRLFEDPRAATDVAASETRRTAVLLDHLRAWERLVSSASLDPEKEAEPLDDATLEKLKSLGYVQ